MKMCKLGLTIRYIANLHYHLHCVFHFFSVWWHYRLKTHQHNEKNPEKAFHHLNAVLKRRLATILIWMVSRDDWAELQHKWFVNFSVAEKRGSVVVRLMIMIVPDSVPFSKLVSWLYSLIWNSLSYIHRTMQQTLADGHLPSSWDACGRLRALSRMNAVCF